MQLFREYQSSLYETNFSSEKHGIKINFLSLEITAIAILINGAEIFIMFTEQNLRKKSECNYLYTMKP